MKTVFTIIGSGFGLYGYLPALLQEIAKEIVLFKKYENKIKLRQELSLYTNNICWATNLHTALQNSEGVVIAGLPKNQTSIVDECLKYKNIKYFFVEKPLAHDINHAHLLLDKLINSKKKFRIGYTFLYTAWHQELKNRIKKNAPSETIFIDWKFHAHHFVENISNWKRSDLQGGGVLKFYGIHIIAVLADLGYSTVNTSQTYEKNENETEQWHANFSGESLPLCQVQINCRSKKAEFSIKEKSSESTTTHIELDDPFGVLEYIEKNNEDRRVNVLRKLCSSIHSDNEQVYYLYKKVNILWAETELITEKLKIMNSEV